MTRINKNQTLQHHSISCVSQKNKLGRLSRRTVTKLEMATVWDPHTLPVEYGESPLPHLKDCISPETLSILWASKTDQEMKTALLEDVFLFGNWRFRNDDRADIYTDFYLRLIKFLHFFFIVSNIVSQYHLSIGIANLLVFRQKLPLHSFISFLKLTSKHAV